MKDNYGNTISHNSPDALHGYHEAILAYQNYFADPAAILKKTLTAHPDFTLGHIFRAIVLIQSTEQRYLPAARKSLDRAAKLLTGANDRERSLHAATCTLASGNWDRACLEYDHHMSLYPRDALAIQTAHMTDFLRGDNVNLRNRLARILPSWSEDTPGFSYLLGMYAFGLEECNEYAHADEIVDRALQIEPRDPWAIHAKTHVREMQGESGQGIKFLESHLADWTPDNGLQYHNWWHLALFHLDTGNYAQALTILDDEIFPGSAETSMALLDVTSFLWRLRLLGVDLGARFATVADLWAEKTQYETGYYAFNDFHAALAFAGAERGDSLNNLIVEIKKPKNPTGTTLQKMNTQVGIPLIIAIKLYCDGNFSAAAEAIEKIRDTASRFGGSHAQRDLLSWTLIDAANQAGQKGKARHFLAERLVNKRNSGITQWFQEKIG